MKYIIRVLAHSKKYRKTAVLRLQSLSLSSLLKVTDRILFKVFRIGEKNNRPNFVNVKRNEKTVRVNVFCRCRFCRFEISHFTPLAERTVSQQSYVFFLSARIPKILSKTVRSAGSLRSTLFSGNKSPSSRYFGVVVFRFPQLFFFF